MKKLLLAALFIGLVVGTAQATMRDFESYTPTTAARVQSVDSPDDFRETHPAEFSFGPDMGCHFVGGTLWDVFIREETPGGNQYIELNTGGCWGLLAIRDTLDTIANPTQILSFDMRYGLIDNPPEENPPRISLGLYKGYFPFDPDNNYWDKTGNIGMASDTPEGGPYTTGYWYVQDEANNQTGEILAVDTWYTIESEWDFIYGSVRTRIAPRGGAFGAWSDPVYGLDVTETTAIQFQGEDTILDLDNISLTPGGVGSVPEPGTIGLLGLGLVALLRKRK